MSRYPVFYLTRSELGNIILENKVLCFPKFVTAMYLLFKDRAHLLRPLSAEGKIDQMLDLEAEMELRAHIWPFDSTREYFDP